MRNLTPDEIETLRRAGIAWPEDAEDQREVARRLQERVAKVVEAITRAAEVFVDTLAAAFGSTVELYEELKDLGVDLPEREPEQHDGAITQEAIEVLLPLILRELYGQGIDYGGLAHPV